MTTVWVFYLALAGQLIQPIPGSPFFDSETACVAAIPAPGAAPPAFAAIQAPYSVGCGPIEIDD